MFNAQFSMLNFQVDISTEACFNQPYLLALTLVEKYSTCSYLITLFVCRVCR